MTATLSHRNSTEFIGAQHKATGVNSDFQERQSYLEHLQYAKGRHTDSGSNYYFLSPHPFSLCCSAKIISLWTLQHWTLLELVAISMATLWFSAQELVKWFLGYLSAWTHGGNIVWPNNTLSDFVSPWTSSSRLADWEICELITVYTKQIGKGPICLEFCCFVFVCLF